MDMKETTLKAIRLKGHIGSDRKLEITEDAVELPEGDVEIILLYSQSIKRSERPSPLTLPTEWETLSGWISTPRGDLWKRWKIIGAWLIPMS
jgi:hypothetical protein